MKIMISGNILSICLIIKIMVYNDNIVLINREQIDQPPILIQIYYKHNKVLLLINCIEWKKKI